MRHEKMIALVGTISFVCLVLSPSMVYGQWIVNSSSTSTTYPSSQSPSGGSNGIHWEWAIGGYFDAEFEVQPDSMSVGAGGWGYSTALIDSNQPVGPLFACVYAHSSAYAYYKWIGNPSQSPSRTSTLNINVAGFVNCFGDAWATFGNGESGTAESYAEFGSEGNGQNDMAYGYGWVGGSVTASSNGGGGAGGSGAGSVNNPGGSGNLGWYGWWADVVVWLQDEQYTSAPGAILYHASTQVSGFCYSSVAISIPGGPGPYEAYCGSDSYFEGDGSMSITFN